MKRRLDTIKGKRLVTGDPNLMTKDEICINATSNGVEVKEIGVDGKVKDLANSGGGNNKEYDDLNTYLYYDDRIVSADSMELPLCAVIANAVGQLAQNYYNLNTIIKVTNTEDLVGINSGNYIPIESLLQSSGFLDKASLLLIKGISIPKYIFPELIIHISGVPYEIDKIHIFDLMKVAFGESAESFVEFLKTQPTITREEFFDLLK